MQFNELLSGNLVVLVPITKGKRAQTHERGKHHKIQKHQNN